MRRITYKHLNNVLEWLNEMSMKKYEIEGCYGLVRLVSRTEKHGVINISTLMSKRELYETISAIINYVRNEARE